MAQQTKTVTAVDVGYGYTKAHTSTEQTLFKSIIGPAMALAYSTHLGSAEGNEPEIGIAGKSYFIGEKARLQSRHPIAPQAKDRSLALVKVLALAGIAQVANGAPQEVVTGLPVDWYAAQKDALRAALTGNHVIDVDGVSRAITIDRVDVIPQHLGAVYREIIDAAGHLTDRQKLSQRKAAVVDVGNNTTGYCLVDSLRFIKHKSHSIDTHSMGNVYRILRDTLNARYQFDLSLVDTEAAARAGFVTHYGKDIEITNELQEAAAAIAPGIVQHALELWPDWSTYTAILITGGGAELFAPHIQATLKHARVVSNPQLANVEGMLRLGLLRSRRT